MFCRRTFQILLTFGTRCVPRTWLAVATPHNADCLGAQANALYDAESPLFAPVVGQALILSDVAWQGIARVLSCDENVRQLQLKNLQAPFKALYAQHRGTPGPDALKPLVTQLVSQLQWLWKKNLLKVQEGFLSHKSTAI